MKCTKCKNSLATGLKCTKCGYENEVKIPSPPILSRIYQNLIYSLIDSPVIWIIFLANFILRELDIFSIPFIVLAIIVALHSFINGILLLRGDCKHFFDRYRKMPIDELEKYYDRKAIYKYEGTVAIILSLTVLIVLFGIFIDVVAVVLSGIFGLLATSFICGLYAAKTKRFMKTESNIEKE